MSGGTVDSAEAWLVEHDPDYAETSKAWKQITTGEYVQPSQEACWDEDEYGPVADLVDDGKGKIIGPYPRKKCADCPYMFAPSWAYQAYCSDRCRRRVEKRRERARNVGGHSHT